MVLVVLQAGHCFRRSGATGTNGLDGDPNEQAFAWVAANRAAGLLRDAGHGARVILADVATSDYGGDVFVAVHCDGSTNPAARGASVGYRTPEGQAFAAAWKRAYTARGWTGWRSDNYTAALAGYYGTRNAVARGIRHAFIAEAGFLTSPADEALLSPPHGPERFATALTAAVVELFGGVAPSPATPPPPPVQEDDDMPLILRSPNSHGIHLALPDAPVIHLGDVETVNALKAAHVEDVPISDGDFARIVEAKNAHKLLLEAILSKLDAILTKLGT